MEVEFEKERRTVLIAGAGISGLASALFLARAGYRVELFEQAEKFDTLGAGLQLSPNAMHVLASLGLDRQVKAAATAPPQIDILDAISGQAITHITLGTQIVRQYNQPYLVIYRADLQKILVAACKSEPDIQLRMGIKVRDAVAHPNGISMLADDKSGTNNYRGHFLIGADGIHSVIRRECFTARDVKPAKSFALRALLRSEALPKSLKSGNITMWLGTQAHGVMYPVRGGSYSNVIVTVDRSFCKSTHQHTIPAYEICEQLSDWNEPFRALFDINSKWTLWPIQSVPKLRQWHQEFIVLVGDAAHGLSPHAAQGAAMGLEDAAVLASALTKETEVKAAFARYQESRIKRLNNVRAFSDHNRMIYQLPKNLATLRNVAMKTLGGKGILRRQKWIFGWKPPG